MDIISVQSDAMTESTLESEIDALSKIITDTKDGVKKHEDINHDFKLDSDNLVFNDNLQYDTLDKDESELLPTNSLELRDVFDNNDEIKNFSYSSAIKSNLHQISSKLCVFLIINE
jgi:hypothetical protein